MVRRVGGGSRRYVQVLRRTPSLAGVVRVLGVASLLCTASLASGVASASAQGSGYFVTFVARSCPDYTDIYANKARNDILESLKDLGPDTQYSTGQLVNPTAESIPPQDKCRPIVGWQYTLGTGYQTHAVTGPWGSLSIVTNPFARAPIVTQVHTPLLDDNALPIGNEQLAGATTIELTPQERAQASTPSQLWAQGGTPTDPVLAQKFPGPQYGFGALRCATDNVNGDNVEYIFFPTGVRHVFCYGLYVLPPPTSGTITIQKRVTGAPAGDVTSFPFNGSISYDPNGFQLGAGGAEDFYRAGGSTWTVTEGGVANYRLADLSCTAVAPGGGQGTSTVDISGPTASIHLVAGDHVTCVFTNSYVPPPGGLTIRKVTRGGVGRFRYSVAPASGGGRTHTAQATTTEPNVAADAQPSLLNLAPGRYRIREKPPKPPGGHWRLLKVRCNDTSPSTSRPVEVDVLSGQAITCTFVNVFVPNGSISLAKITEGGVGTAAFLVLPLRQPSVQFHQTATTKTPGVAAAAVPTTAADSTAQLPLGSYRIVEQPPPGGGGGWALTEVKCDGVLVPFAQGSILLALTRTSSDAHCVFRDTFTPHPPPPPLPPPPPPPPKPPAPLLADLVVTKHASAQIVTRGDVVHYRITVTNLGPDPAARVVLGDQPLGSAAVVGAHTNVGSCKTRLPVICQLGTLKRGAKVTLTIALRVQTGKATFTNLAVVGTATAERTLANNSATAHVRVRPLKPPPPPPPPVPQFTG
jgi:uncharacterized repeat protein (TIGR01451 family)